MMTRFEKELNGMLGAFWQKNAENELAEIRDDLAAGRITIDEIGVARNSIGRVVAEDMAEKIALAGGAIDRKVTEAFYRAEMAAVLADYRKNVRAVLACLDIFSVIP